VKKDDEESCVYFCTVVCICPKEQVLRIPPQIHACAIDHSPRISVINWSSQGPDLSPEIEPKPTSHPADLVTAHHLDFTVRSNVVQVGRFRGGGELQSDSLLISGMDKNARRITALRSVLPKLFPFEILEGVSDSSSRTLCKAQV
jgi:hypothetical protein